MIKRIKDILVVLLLFAVVTKVLWWSIEPAIPYLLASWVIVLIIGFLVYRSFKWPGRR